MVLRYHNLIQNQPLLQALTGLGLTEFDELVETILPGYTAAEKKRLNGLMLKSPMRVYRAYGELGRAVFADGALSKKHKELTALAVAVSQNCFD